MGIMSPKLILIIVISVAILVLSGIWIKGAFFREEVKVLNWDRENSTISPVVQEWFIRRHSFINDSSKEISQFVMSLYDENEFKVTKNSQPSLEATYYGIEALQTVGSLSKISNPEAMFNKIRSYYVSPGYFLEKDKDPVFSTGQALRVDRWYQEDLGKTIDLDWLKSNSIENKNLEQDKFDPEYQSAVVETYRHLEIPEKPKKLEEISYPYFDYYCNFKPPEGISDSDYLKTKHYQISLISSLSGISNVNNLSGCLKTEDVKADKERLSKIQFEDLNDIKQVYWLYYLKKFYNLWPRQSEQFFSYLENIFKKVKQFYSDGGFKEKLSDKEPGLIGTYYGILFIK